MPVAFLTAEQRSRYGCYVGEPSPEQLALYFHLDDRDRALLEPRRHDHTRLGFALQLCTVRFLGTFLSDPTDVPHTVVLTLASQLNIADPTVLSRYLEGQMRYDHVHEIMQVYGYQDFASQPAHFRFLRWLYTRAWWSEERLTVLFDLAMAHLVDRKVLLPGVSVLERAVASVREYATTRLWQRLAQIPTPPQVALLETLLVVPEGERQTPLDRLRRAPTRVSGPALVQALHRVDAIRLFEMEYLDLSFVPKGRVKALARYATTAFVHNLRQLGQDHLIATLLAFAHTYLAVVHDDALDLFDVLMRTASSQATREGQQARLRTIHDLDAAAQVLSEACQVVLDETQDPVTLRERIYARVSAEHLQAAITTVGEHMLYLAFPGAANQRSYRAVLEVSPINLSLKAEEEQEAIIARYQMLIKSLTYSLQVLVRNSRLDLTPYIQRLLAAPPEGTCCSPGWEVLAGSLADLLQRLAAERTLIERHVYVIVPAPQQPTRTRRWGAFSRLLPGRRRTRQRRQEAEQAQVAQDLALRVESLGHQLAACGLSGHRLTTPELAQLVYACLTPERALAHPLTPAVLAQVDRPFSHRRRRPVRDARHAEKEATEEEIAEEESSFGDEVLSTDPTLPPVPPPDLLPLVDMLAPACLEITPEAVRVGQEYACGIALTTCPREVSFDGWLAPLFLHDEVMDIAFHYHPQDTATMKRQLQRHRAGHLSGRHFNQRQGRTDDPDTLVAEEDITRLLDDLARHRERVLDLGCYILVWATDRRQLVERWERILAVLSLLSLDTGAHATTFEQAEAFHACLPEGRDALMRTQTLDATTLATMFPFLSNSLYMPDGVFMGCTETHEPVLLDPWDSSLENPHLFIGGVTGSGKSYLGKLLIERDLLVHAGRGDQCFVIDPDLEYQGLAEALGGTVVRLAPGAEQRLNPFDLLPPGCDLETYLAEARKGDRLAERISDLHTMLDIMLADSVSSSLSGGGMLSKREKGLLDRVLYETYRKAGITGDLRTHDRQPPLVRDLYDILKSGVCGTDESDLAGRLFRFVSGSLSSLFADFTSVDLASQLVVWDIRDMRSELRPLAISLIADRIWTQALYQSSRPRSLYIDEAASLMEHPEGGHFLATLSRRARKRYLRIVTMTQNPETFVQDTWGSVVAANAAIKVLKTQDATSAAAVAERFHLTKSEQQRLITLGKHEALVLAGEKRVIITIEASQQEHALITTNPVERAAQEQRTQEQRAREEPEVTPWSVSIAPPSLQSDERDSIFPSGTGTMRENNGHTGNRDNGLNRRRQTTIEQGQRAAHEAYDEYDEHDEQPATHDTPC